MIVRPLRADDFDEVHAAFLSAFSDYVVPMAPARDRLLETLTRRGYVPSASVCAVDDDRIVAFTLNAVEGEHGYDSGTGVVPSHRRRGLAARMMTESFALLQAHGCRDYTLEVIDTNSAAATLYRELGFRETRPLQCWTYDDDRSTEPPTICDALPADSHDWAEVRPSWQNTLESVRRSRDEVVVAGDANGYVIVYPLTGDVPLLVVRPEARRRGIGRNLLRQARAIAGRPLRIINVDAGAETATAFLLATGATKTVRQLEMTRPL